LSWPKLKMKSIAVIVMACILAASLAGYLYLNYFRVGKDIVAIINVRGAIIYPEDVERCTAIINHAIVNDSIRGVVLRIDSPGGYVDLVEQIYLDLLELKRVKPVVASISFAASGGYYIAVAADYIYTEPTTFLGNVGVIGTTPPTLIPSEVVLETGPYKVSGFSPLLFPFNLSAALDNFVSAVETGRGDRLRLTSLQLRKGLLYIGSEAVEVGLADEIGSLQKAIKKVAEKAGIRKYDVVDLNSVFSGSYVLGSYANQTSILEWRSLTLEALSKIRPPPSILYLYLQPLAFRQSTSVDEELGSNQDAKAFGGDGKRTVLVDNSHGNRVSAWQLDILIAELAMRNTTVRFIQYWRELELSLHDASCLIVASPTTPYSIEESDRIEQFVSDGGTLLLFYDPAYEYVEIPELFGPINSLSTGFGLSFAKGYLYNELENYGFYRNVYVRAFANSPVTQNLESLVFFTAAHIYSLNKGVAWASNNTYSSAAERPGNYTVIALVNRGKGTVVAFGDQTFLEEPFCYVEDNQRLILNLVSVITGVELTDSKKTEEGGIEEEVVRPDIPVGTEKNYTEQIDGNESLVRWFKVSDAEIRVERPNQTTHYYFDKDGGLLSWESDGMECLYDTPIPELPFPLTKGKRWTYESSYTLDWNGKQYKGKISAQEVVEGFEDILAGDNRRYFCARVKFTGIDHLAIEGADMKVIMEELYWISSEAGSVKEESINRYYVDGTLVSEERRVLLLKSIKKGSVLQRPLEEFFTTVPRF